ncbi:MAG: 50S ribosomal protein L24 [Parvularculales bacterium]
MKIKKGDRVVVLSGRDKGRKGEVIGVFPQEGRALVQGINMVKRHERPSQVNPSGDIQVREAKIHLSNLGHEDPETGKPTRVGYRFLDDGRKVRFARASGVNIDD